MLVLALDPGFTTGIALVDQHGVLFTAACPVPGIFTIMNHVKMEVVSPHIVMEMAPLRAGGEKAAWAACRNYARGLFPDAEIHEISPGQWKPLASILKQPDDKFATNHERDAAYLARFYIRQLTAKKGSQDAM